MTRKILVVFGLLWSVVASAQFVPGQVLTAAELNNAFALYAPLTGATFTGPVSATSISGTLISGSSGAFTNLSASGSVSLPAGTVTPTSLAVQSANTVLANTLGAAASPTAAAIPSCSTSSSALQWSSGVGFACNTSVNSATLGGVAAASYLTTASAASIYAPLASPALTGTPTAPSPTVLTNNTQLATTASVINVLGSGDFLGAFNSVTATTTITPSQTGGIVGTTTNNNANAGSVGEYQAFGGGSVPLTSGTVTNATSISLTAGDWDVESVQLFQTSVGGSLVFAYSSVSTTSVTLGGVGQYTLSGGALGAQLAVTSPVVRVNLAATTTVYAVTEVSFATGTCNVFGFLRARRVR